MKKEEIFAELEKTMLELFELEPGDVTLEAKLREDLGLDSIDAIDMAVKLQKMTGKRVELSALKCIVTVQDVVDLIYSYLEKR
jgi:acyl carrier protein